MSFWGDDYRKREQSKGNGRWTSASGYRDGGLRSWVKLGFILMMIILVLILLLLPFRLNKEQYPLGGYSASIPALASERGAERLEELSVVQIAAQVKPAVVSIITYTEEPSGQGEEQRQGAGTGLGSGIIFAIHQNKALVVTNHHVIEGGVSHEVVLTNGNRRSAKLIGSDVFTDLAVMEIDGKGIEKIARFGDSDGLQEGESVVAIGNPLGISYSLTITVGFVSGLNTPVPVSLGQNGQVDWEVELIQTDAAINRGNSGGALVNRFGQVIGINSMKVSDYGVEGLGFAIPINDAVAVLADLLEYGKVKRPFIGVATMDLSMFLAGVEVLALPDDVQSGVIVMSAEGPAAEAGLLMSDVIVALDDRAIGSTLALRKYLYEDKQIGDNVKVSFYREGKLQSVKLKLQERE